VKAGRRHGPVISIGLARGYESVPHARESLDAYFTFYNGERPHQALNNATPWQCHYAGARS